MKTQRTDDLIRRYLVLRDILRHLEMDIEELQSAPYPDAMQDTQLMMLGAARREIQRGECGRQQIEETLKRLGVTLPSEDEELQDILCTLLECKKRLRTISVSEAINARQDITEGIHKLERYLQTPKEST